MFGFKDTLAPVLSLFTSFTTLICCALPALFVSLGMGAVVAGMVSSMPWLVWLSDHKVIVFAVAAILIVIAGGLMWHARNLPCPADPKKAKACAILRKISWGILGLSVGLYLIGFSFAFLLKYFI